MNILYINVIEQHEGWGTEFFVNQSFMRNGHETVTIDFREHRNSLAPKFLACQDFDVLFLQRGDWFPIELLKSVNRPRFYWASELVSRCRDQDRLLASGMFDHVFVRGPECKRTVTRNSWLPSDRVSILLSGFDKYIHYKIPDLRKEIDILFVGSITPRRERILNRLKMKFNISIHAAYGEKMVQLFNRSKIILNIHADDFIDTETRIFEALGSGSFVLTEKLGAENPFIHQKHLVEAGNEEELNALLKFYLDHKRERYKIADQGYQEALEKHTYTNRAEQIIGTMDSYLPHNGMLPAIDAAKVKRYQRKEYLLKYKRHARLLFEKLVCRIPTQ